MKLKINEMAGITGVSVRTLHYYDAIGLLTPSVVDAHNGYRYYDEAALERMQEILFYRELDFPLKSIAALLSSPDYNKARALSAQRELLTLKKERLERLIAALDDAAKGENTMEFKQFDNSAYEAKRAEYAAEAKERWGETDAYRESAEKAKGRTAKEEAGMMAGMDALLAQFSACRTSGATPQSDAAQALVKQWQDFITENCYTCTNEILAGLGQMYTVDARFMENIDRHGAGTAAFLRDAIAAYCA